jgi:hypothetical protein
MHLQSTLALGLLANSVAADGFDCGTSGSSSSLKALSKDLANKHLEIRGHPKNVEVKTYVHIIAASKKEEDGYLSASHTKAFAACLLTLPSNTLSKNRWIS